MIVSIIIPIYNVEKYVLECLQSVANQTLTEEIECILVDDCGTDCSAQITEEFIATYHGPIQFQLLHHEKNGGLSAARNTGIKQAKGEYLLFLDSDDVLLPNAIECFLKELERHSDVDMIQGAYKSEMTKRYDSIVLPEYTNDRQVIKTLMLDYDKMPIMAQNRLVKRKLIVEENLYFKEGIIHEDCYWSFFLAKHVSSLACLNEKTYYYRFNPNSITGKPNNEKETYSFRVIVEDFCNNIDVFLKGEQKATILYHLNMIFNNHYYDNAVQKQKLFNCLYQRCNILEKYFLRLWFNSKAEGIKKDKRLNLCIKLFRMMG